MSRAVELQNHCLLFLPVSKISSKCFMKNKENKNLGENINALNPQQQKSTVF